MIIDLTDTTSSEIASALLKARRNAGSPAMGMVGTIVVVVDEASHHDAMKAANEAGREHPSRVLVAILRPGRGRPGWTPRSGSAKAFRARRCCCGCTVSWPRFPSPSSRRCCCPTPPSSSGGRVAGRRFRPRTRWVRLGRRRVTDAALGAGLDGGLHRARRGLRAGRHRLRVDAAHAVACADGGGALDQYPTKVHAAPRCVSAKGNPVRI